MRCPPSPPNKTETGKTKKTCKIQKPAGEPSSKYNGHCQSIPVEVSAKWIRAPIWRF
jgi:hypothetical protein